MTGSELWRYRAKITRVVDGDTLDATLDLGFGVNLTGNEARVRLAGVDTAEIFGVKKGSAEYRDGQRHRDWVFSWVRDRRAESEYDWPFLVTTDKGDERGKYGRYVGHVRDRESGRVLNDDLVTQFPEVADE